MNKKSLSKLAFSFALVAVMLVLATGTSVAQKQLIELGYPPCPTLECPSNLSGYTYAGHCETVFAHDCVEQCNVYAQGRTRCRTNCHNQ